MKIGIAGAGGLIGSGVASYLESQQHMVIRLVRREAAANEISWDPDAGTIDTVGMEGLDAVVNLASMPWPMRWTATAKQQIYDNRIRINSLLAETISRRKQKPGVLVCASGMGIYPSSGDQFITEDNPTGTDFLATLQRDGEVAAMKAAAAGIRVVNLRIPPVLGGAAIRRSMGRIGDGRQWSSWIARDELVRIIEFVLSSNSLAGPVNPASPNPVRNADYVAVVSRVLGNRPGMPIPAFMLQLMLGEMADALMLASRRMQPEKLLAAGYAFRFPDLEGAIRHELEKA